MTDDKVKTSKTSNTLPSGWIETTLGEVCVFNYGKGLKTEERIFGSIPVYGSGGITGLHNKALINEKGLIIGRKGSVGTIFKSKNAFYPIDTVFYITQKDTVCDLEFLYRLLQSLGLDKKNSDSAVPGLNRENAYSTQIILPPLPEQKAIASVLSAFDDKIELLREENKTLEEIGKTIFNEWFGKYGVDEELPEGWRVGKISEVIIRDTIPYKCDKKDLDPKGVIPILDQGTNGVYGYTSRAPDFLAKKENPVIIFTNHTCNYWFIDYPFCAIQNVIPFRGKKGYSVHFLYFLTKGSITFTEYKGHWPDFEAKDFVIPPVELVQKASKTFQSVLQKMSNNMFQIQSLSRTREELLPRLMSGEVRVKDFYKL